MGNLMCYLREESDDKMEDRTEEFLKIRSQKLFLKIQSQKLVFFVDCFDQLHFRGR